MLKIGSQLVNEELVQIAQYDPEVPMLSLFISGQVNLFTGPDVPEAWRILQPETGFVSVGSDGLTLINTNLVEVAFISLGQFVFRIQGRDYTFDSPGKFDFSALTGPAVSEIGAAVSDTSESSENAADWENVVKKNGA